MNSILIGIGIWCGASIPVSLIVGRALRHSERDLHDPEDCEWCRPDLEEDA